MVTAMTDNAATNSKEAFELLRRVLTQIDWASEPDEENASFYIDFGPPFLPVSDAIAAIAMEAQQFLFYVNIGPLAPEDRRDEVARFITLANWGLSIGNFEMDYEDGFVRFRSSLDFCNAGLTETLIRNTILAAMNAIEAYAQPLVDVLGRGKDAQKAFREAQARQN